QTPGYPEKTGLAHMQATAHKFPMMLDPNEHLFLFSPASASELFRRLGAPYIEFIPAIFGFYDMSFVVSRSLLAQTTDEEQSNALCATLSGRFMQAVLDLDDRRINLLNKFRNLSQQAQRIAG